MSRTLTTQLLSAGDGFLEIEAAELRVTGGPDKGMKVPLGGESLRIGTSAECEVVLHDPAVSGKHAEIFVAASGYRVRDLGSKNGILLDGWPIERAPLVDGMKLKVGQTTIAVHALGKKSTIPLGRSGAFGRVLAHSVKMRAAVATMQQLAASDVTVLIEGETGTGKEVAAEAVHQHSARAKGPFVVFDCGAVNPSMIASELFGHERGAFTGATQMRTGLFETAHGGTLFLDEIGELPLPLQPVLLGAIERRVSRRVGGNEDIAHDVRIVAATNRNLAEEVRAKRFREDLYFRLAVGKVRLPPLRERTEDIALLAHAFAQEVGARLTPELLALFSTYDWPGNVRELRNAVARIAVHPDPPSMLLPVGAKAESASSRESYLEQPISEARRRVNDDFERAYVEHALERAGGQVSRAAELAGISRQMMTRLVAKHGLRARDRAE